MIRHLLRPSRDRSRELLPSPHHIMAVAPGQTMARNADRASDVVLTAPGGSLYNINPRLASRCALVRDGGRLVFYVLAGTQSSAEIEHFITQATLALGEEIPTPTVVDQHRLRSINVRQAEARLAGQKGTESRARLNGLIGRAAASMTNDVKLDRSSERAMVRFQKNNYLSEPIRRFDMTSEDADLLITSAFNFADAGDSVEQPTADQKFTITDPGKLPANLQAIRCQTAALEGGGRRLDMRFIYRATELSARSLGDIGLLPEHLDNLHYVQNVGSGLFTITAPTDNGKSTTLNLFSIDMVRARDGRIDVIGIDDPVEFMAPEICQLALGERADDGDPFEQKLLTTLRLAPHAIKIGECRTGPTANAAIDAAYTGKLVMTTQHSAGAFGVPFRYERMGVDRHVAFDPDTHVCWMSQRLIPGLCPGCRVPLETLPRSFDPRRMAIIRRFRPILDHYDGRYFMRGPGCSQCQGDQSGDMPGLGRRLLVAEVLLPDREICALLADRQEQQARRRAIIELNCPTMVLHGFRLLRGGVIGLEEFMAIASPSQLKEDLQAEEDGHAGRAHREAAE